MSLSPADLLLASLLGRQLLASYVGWGPGGSLEDALFERLGLGPVLTDQLSGQARRHVLPANTAQVTPLTC